MSQDQNNISGRVPVGFVGLGHMGSAMAANLAAAGHRVMAYVRRPEQIERFAALGLEPTTDLGNLADCPIVISMVSDDSAARDIVFGNNAPGMRGLAEILPRGATHISMSTIGTLTSAALHEEHSRHAQGYVAAPVFGNPAAAQARQLFVIAAGDPAELERCQPLFDVLGQKTFRLDREPEHANLVKLLGNMLTAATLEILGEIVAVVRKRGLDPESFVDIMTSTMFGGRAHKIYGEKIVKQSYAAGFVLPLVLKDVRLALAEAEHANAPLPSVDVVRDRLITGIARGYGELDWSALGLVAAEEAGIGSHSLPHQH